MACPSFIRPPYHVATTVTARSRAFYPAWHRVRLSLGSPSSAPFRVSVRTLTGSQRLGGGWRRGRCRFRTSGLGQARGRCALRVALLSSIEPAGEEGDPPRGLLTVAGRSVLRH